MKFYTCALVVTLNKSKPDNRLFWQDISRKYLVHLVSQGEYFMFDDYCCFRSSYLTPFITIFLTRDIYKPVWVTKGTVRNGAVYSSSLHTNGSWYFTKFYKMTYMFIRCSHTCRSTGADLNKVMQKSRIGVQLEDGTNVLLPLYQTTWLTFQKTLILVLTITCASHHVTEQLNA